MRRNRGQKGYRHYQADELAYDRQCEAYRSRIAWQTWQQVEQLLRQEWSPEQIAGYLKLTNNPPSAMNASTSTFMRTNVAVALCIAIYAVKRSSASVIAGTSAGARSPIESALISVPRSWLSKGRFGDWEADTIVGARHKGGILSAVERKSKLTRLRKLTTKAADEMKDNTIELLAPLAAKVHTITVDNGKEFCEHQLIAAGLQARIYFAHPYASWERGLNENTNGLVRQYFPKKYEFARITDEDLQQVEDRLNNRPRKTLGYKTPNEVFFKQRSVALRS